jgi:alkanesulfonate monooxygenase SsuD/methylene tetrahydromethanopterin reductase-like flavin-dependent oxidoreductase (luciferase family)
MRIGAGLDARLGLKFDELREAGREAARLGFESLWTPAGGVPDAFHVCAAWLSDSRLRAGISVVPAPRLWTPVALAIQAATVAQISDGRFTLGIGTGGYGRGFWRSAGLPDRPIAVMRDYLTILRGLLAGQTVTHDGLVSVHGATLGVTGLPPVPVQLGALGPQMVRLAGECSDGALLNWATPERIAESRRLVAEGAARAGRDPGECPLVMYIRVCVDDDVAAARRALGRQVLSYAMAKQGTPLTSGYRGMFAQMGFGEVLLDLERRQAAGENLDALVDDAPDELFSAVGYFGPAAGAPEAFARLSAGLDEAMVRVVTARPGLEPVIMALEALKPARISHA